jgi:hypothetical protein
MGTSDPWSGRLHDAEVLSVLLDRTGPTLELNVALDPQLSAGPPLRLVFEEISELELVGFNHQNVLFDVTATKSDDGSWQVRLSSSYGVSGTFRCNRLPEVPGL